MSLKDLRSSIPACGYCALCGALRYRGAAGVICSDGCKQALITPVPELAERKVDFKFPGLGTTVPETPPCYGCVDGGCELCGPPPGPAMLQRKNTPGLPPLHPEVIGTPYRATSYLVEELERAADLLREAAEHIRRSP